MAGFQIIARSAKDLEGIVRPSGGLEYYPHALYDTVSYVSGTTVSAQYFTTIQSDKTLGNMEGASQLATDQYFECHRAYCDLFVPPEVDTAAAATPSVPSALSDVHKLIFTGQGTFQVTYQNKLYGPEPLSMAQGTGGAQGGAALYGTAGATNNGQSSWAVNGNVASGGFFYGGRLVFRPKSTFFVTLVWTAAQTLVNGNTKIRFVLQGVLYRPVA